MDLRKYFKAKEPKKIEKQEKNEKVETKKEICKYGSKCYQKNPNHFAKFLHPKRSSEETTENESKKIKMEEPPVANIDQTSDSIQINSQSSGHNISESEDEGELGTSAKPEESFENVNTASDDDPLLDIDLSTDTKLALNQLYVVRFPDDFYNFYEFCESVYAKSPKTALRDIGLELVGPYDFLAGKIKSCTRTEIIRHYRFYFDPPEFFTVLKSTDSELHYGYYFDDPNQSSSLVVSNDPKTGCTIKIISSNLFGAVITHINNYAKTSDPFQKIKIQKIQNLLTKWTKEHKVNTDSNALSIRERNSKVNSKTFHGAGIVVPYDKKTDVGYRPLAENNKTLKDLFQKIAESDSEGERKVRWNKIEHVITFASIAADECDFGTPLELGIDMFCQGHQCFHRTAKQLMTLAYDLLNRNYFADIIKVHLKHRVKGSNLNFAAKN